MTKATHTVMEATAIERVKIEIERMEIDWKKTEIAREVIGFDQEATDIAQQPET